MHRLSASGFAIYAIPGGSTSGIPPTSVLTTNRPQEAASSIDKQKDSVSDVFKKICPLQSAYLT